MTGRCHTHSVVVELIYVNEILLMLQTLKSIRHTHSELRAAADETYECVWRNRRIWTLQCVSYSVLCCSRHSIDTHPWKSCSSAGTSLALWKTRSRDFTWKMRSVTMVHSVVARLLSIKEKLQWLLKGIVHPKMNFLWLFIHPQVVPNLYEFLLPDKHKRRYFKECEKLNSFKEFGISKVPHDNIFILLNYPFKTAIHISIIIVLLFWNYYYYCIFLKKYFIKLYFYFTVKYYNSITFYLHCLIFI